MIIKADQLSKLFNAQSGIGLGTANKKPKSSATMNTARAISVSRTVPAKHGTNITPTYNPKLAEMRAEGRKNEAASYQARENSFYTSTAYDNQYNGKSDDDLLKSAANYLFYFAAKSDAEIGYNGAQKQAYKDMYNRMVSGLSSDIPNLVTREEQYKSITEAVSNGFLLGVFSEQEILFALDRAFDPTLDEPYSVRASAAPGYSYSSFTDSPLYIDRQIENAAAHYAFYATKAAECYQGEEYDEAMKLIDATFDKALDDQFNRFIGNGQYLQADAAGVKDSIKAIFNERKDVYTSILQSDEFSLGVEGTENAWAAESSYFTSAKLRQYADCNITPIGEVATDAKYTINDLKSFAIVNNNQMSTYSNSLQGKSEEELGMYLGIEAVKMELLIRDGNLSEDGKATLRESFDMYVKQVIDGFNQTLQMMRDGNKKLPSEWRYDPVNEDAVYGAIKTMLNAINSDNLELALRNSMQSIRELFTAKQQSQYEQGYIQNRYSYAINANMSPTTWKATYNPMDLARVNSINLLASYLENNNYQVSTSLFTSLDVAL